MVIWVYFTNITNEELQYFKRESINNFNIDLTDILSSDLFKVEEIVSNSIYRIYPLFNCEKIISSDSDNIILENKCIIVTKKDNESYFNFISKELETIYHQNKLTGYKDIGDSLTTEEFNSLIQLLKYNVPFTEEIKINKSNIQGLYGEYIFNLNSSTLVDNGILITNETLESLGTVRLNNPVFKDSNYVLTLKVYHISDININNENSSNIEVTTLEINLMKDIDIEIPFRTIEKDYIIGFDGTISISHNSPVIRQSNNINLIVNLNQIIIGESVGIYAKYVDSCNNPIEGATITFKSNGDVIGQSETNSNGVSTLLYTPSSASIYNLTASCNEVESNIVSLTVNKKTPRLSFIAERRVQGGELIDLYGSISYSGTALENITIKIIDGEGTVIFSPVTDNTGAFNEMLINGANGGSFKAIYEGNSEYNRVESEYIIVAPILYDIILTEENNKSALSYYDEDEAVLVAQGLDANNQLIVAPDVPIRFWRESNNCPYRITTSWLLKINSGDTMTLKLIMENYGMMTISDSGIMVDNGFDTPVSIASPIREVFYSNGLLRVIDDYDNVDIFYIDNFNNRFVRNTSSGTYTIRHFIIEEYTDSTGKARIYYDSEGVGSISFIAENGNVSSNLLNIDDCDVYYVTSQINDFPLVGSTLRFGISDYSISLQNYSLEFKCRQAVQIAVGNQSGWVFACNNALEDSQMYTRTSSGNSYVETGVFGFLNVEYRIEVVGNTIKVYMDNSLLATYTNRKISGFATNLRIYPYENRGNIDYIKVKPL